MSALHDFLSVQQPNEKLIKEQLRESAKEIEKIIARSAKTPRSSAQNVRLAQYRVALSEIRYLLREMWEGGIGPLIADGSIAAAEEAAAMDVLTKRLIESNGLSRSYWESSVRQTAKNNLAAYRQRVEGNSYQPLSARVYRNAELSNGLVDKAVNNALILGKSARELAADVRGLIDPDVRGGVSYSAMRLGRTELNNAFHATTIDFHGSKPWVKGMLWNLSGSHPRSDICDDLSGKTYSPEECPAKPHPNCFCFVTPATVSDDQFIREFKAGKYQPAIDEILSAGD